MTITAIVQATDAQIAELTATLVACVQSGATVGYLRDLNPETAGAYWHGTVEAARTGRLVLLVARGGQEHAIVGTAQLSIHYPPNQPHVVGLNMLIVHPDHRRRGIAAALLNRVEILAGRLGRSLLMLQTSTGSDAERLYRRHGFKLAGIVPGLALHPDGHMTDGAIFWKQVGP